MYDSRNLVLCHPTIIKHEKYVLIHKMMILSFFNLREDIKNQFPPPLPLGPLPSPRSVIYASLEVGSIDLDIR